MERFLLSHRHAAADCGVAFAAWRGFDSPLRHGSALATCGGDRAEGAEHVLWWTVDAPNEQDALALLPPWVAERTNARRVDEVAIP
jgi:hypothetical protein